MRLFEAENKNIDKYKLKIQVLVVLLFSGAGGLQNKSQHKSQHVSAYVWAFAKLKNDHV